MHNCIAALLHLVRLKFSMLNKVDFDCVAGHFAALLILVYTKFCILHLLVTC